MVLVSESHTAHGGCVLFLSAILAATKQSSLLPLSFPLPLFPFPILFFLPFCFSESLLPPSFSKSLSILLYTPPLPPSALPQQTHTPQREHRQSWAVSKSFRQRTYKLFLLTLNIFFSMSGNSLQMTVCVNWQMSELISHTTRKKPRDILQTKKKIFSLSDLGLGKKQKYTGQNAIVELTIRQKLKCSYSNLLWSEFRHWNDRMLYKE